MYLLNGYPKNYRSSPLIKKNRFVGCKPLALTLYFNGNAYSVFAYNNIRESFTYYVSMTNGITKRTQAMHDFFLIQIYLAYPAH